MEDKIRKIVKKEFDAEVIEIKATTEGFSHGMFEVKINREPWEVLVRFSNNKEKYVNLGKEKYVIELMRENNLPVPRIYAFDNSCEAIPEEYMILEKLPGVRLDTIWKSLTKEEKLQITEEIGKLLSRIHSIKFEEFGFIEEGGRIDTDIAFKFKEVGKPLEYSPYLRNKLKEYFIDLVRLISYNYLPKEFFLDYMNFICSNLGVLDYKEKPVLIHNDYMTVHLFVKKKEDKYEIMGLIDFELAISSAPSNDFIKLHRQGFFEDDELKKSLIKGYGEIDEKAVEVLRIMRDVSFAHVLFESGDKEKADEIIKESWGKIKRSLSA